MDVDRMSDGSSSSEDDNSNHLKIIKQQRKSRPSDELDKKLLLQNFALKTQDYNLFKRATQHEAAELAEMVMKELTQVDESQLYGVVELQETDDLANIMNVGIGSDRLDCEHEIENEYWEEIPKPRTEVQANIFINPALTSSIERAELKYKRTTKLH